MRSTIVLVLVAGCATVMAGCKSIEVAEPATHDLSAGSWRVVPLTGSPNLPDRCAILVNQQTGDTWIFNGADQWSPIKRN